MWLKKKKSTKLDSNWTKKLSLIQSKLASWINSETLSLINPGTVTNVELAIWRSELSGLEWRVCMLSCFCFQLTGLSAQKRRSSLLSGNYSSSYTIDIMWSGSDHWVFSSGLQGTSIVTHPSRSWRLVHRAIPYFCWSPLDDSWYQSWLSTEICQVSFQSLGWDWNNVWAVSNGYWGPGESVFSSKCKIFLS